MTLIPRRYTAEIHRFLSTIIYHPIEAISTCGPPPPPEKLAPAFVQEAPIHTAKILQVTELLVDLLALPINLLNQSPLTVCQIATPTVALISACKTVLRGDEVVAARERIRVAIAAIEKFGEVWPRAAKTAKELKIIAREVFGIAKSSASPANSSDSGVVQQYPQGADTGTYQSLYFLDDLMAGTQCDFATLGFENDNTASSNGGIMGDVSMESVTMAY
jgi:hypothetical protein